jgi:hypothetical protein
MVIRPRSISQETIQCRRAQGVGRLTLAKVYPRLEFIERVKAQYDP